MWRNIFRFFRREREERRCRNDNWRRRFAHFIWMSEFDMIDVFID